MTEVTEWGRGLTGPFMKSLNLPGDTPVRFDRILACNSFLKFCDNDAIYRLPADHFVYTVLDYNDEHGTSFVSWAGGDDAPDDWDGGDVLLSDRVTLEAEYVIRWDHAGSWQDDDIIGYTRKEPATEEVELDKHMVDTLGEYVRVKKMTEEDARAMESPAARNAVGNDTISLTILRQLGIINETPVERFKRENPGLTADELLAKALENNK